MRVFIVILILSGTYLIWDYNREKVTYCEFGRDYPIRHNETLIFDGGDKRNRCSCGGNMVYSHHNYEPNLPLGVALGNIGLGLCFDNGKDVYKCDKCGKEEER